LSFSPAFSVGRDPGGTSLPSNPFGFVSMSKQSLLLAEGSTVVWVGLTSSLAVLLVIIIRILLVVVCRRNRSLGSTSAVTESGLDLPADGDRATAGLTRTFLSEENALTVDGSRSGRVRVNDQGRDERILPPTLHE
jgi:hypothetical protein